MNKKHATLLIFCLAISVLFVSNAIAAKKVMLVVGISQVEADKITTTRANTREILNKALTENNAEYKALYVDFRQGDSDAVKTEKGQKAVEEIMQSHPDVIITQFDDALKYVAMKIDDIPIIFTQIFSDPASFGLPKSNITGITRRSFAPDTWALCNQLLGIKKVGLICKDGTSMRLRREELLKMKPALEKASGVQYTDMYLADTFDEWKKLILNWEEDLIHLGDTTRLTDGGRDVSNAEITKWTVENAKVPVIAANEVDVEAGALLSIVNSEEYSNYLTSQMLDELLKGADVSSIPMRPMDKGRLVFNSGTITKMGIEIPYEILSSAEQIYQ